MILPVLIQGGVATLAAAWHLRSSFEDPRSWDTLGPGFRSQRFPVFRAAEIHPSDSFTEHLTKVLIEAVNCGKGFVIFRGASAGIHPSGSFTQHLTKVLIESVDCRVESVVCQGAYAGIRPSDSFTEHSTIVLIESVDCVLGFAVLRGANAGIRPF
jgi:hypothetical protein